MKFDKKALSKLSDKEKNDILLKSGLVFYIIGGIILLLGLMALLGGGKADSLVLIIPGVIVILCGFKNLLLKGENKDNYLTSKLVSSAIKAEINNGNKLSKEEIEKIKFEYDPIFKAKVIANVHKDQDAAYSKNVRNAERNVNNLEQARRNEINRISNERWQVVGGGNLKYNLTEGKININQTEHLFSSIKSAEVNKECSYRIITTESGKSKKHASLGGAVAGGLLLGPVGAVVGGSALGKTTSKGNSVSNSIPTCNHIGVIIDIDGFKSEVILLNHTVDQSSEQYTNALQNAEAIVSKLHYLATQPVPKIFKKVEEEASVLEIGKQIAKAQEELEKVKADKPTYDIPDKYL